VEAERPPRVIPPVYFLAALAGMLVLHRWVPGSRWLGSPWRYVGLAPILVGAWMGIGGARLFAKHRTTLHPFEEPSTLMDEGPFRYSRNPLYASLTLTLFGVALMLGSLVPLLMPPLFAWLVTSRFIRREEEVLERRFGEEYRAYKRRVGRWFGRGSAERQK